MIEIEILSHTLESFKQEKQLDELGLEVEPNEKEGEWKKQIFYNIDYISNALFYPKRSVISSGGTTFICKLSYEELKEYLKNKL